MATFTHAQKFLDVLQQPGTGSGTITVTQSDEITSLVNGKILSTEIKSETRTIPQINETLSAMQNADSVITSDEEIKKKKVIGYENNNVTTDEGTTIVDTRKKIMRHAQKVTGYRIQVYAGGNTRADRVKAEQAGGKVKNAFPSEPVYVHFYSPRWICRMGNYRTYGEAERILKQIKRIGYPQACIVKGKITIQY